VRAANSGGGDDVLVDRRGRGDEDRDARVAGAGRRGRSAATWPRRTPDSRPARTRPAGRCPRPAPARSVLTHSEDVSLAQAILDRPALGGKVSARYPRTRVRGPPCSRSDSRSPGQDQLHPGAERRPKTMVWRPARRNGRAHRWASVIDDPGRPMRVDDRRSTNSTWRSPEGAPFRSTTSGALPVRRAASWPGLGDRRRTRDDDRGRAVVAADSPAGAGARCRRGFRTGRDTGAARPRRSPGLARTAEPLRMVGKGSPRGACRGWSRRPWPAWRIEDRIAPGVSPSVGGRRHFQP